MDDAGGMGAVESVGDLHAEAEDLADRQRPAGDAVGERLAFEQFHDQVAVADVVERADVRMIELRDRLGLALEARPQLRVVRELRRQDLDGHAAVEASVVRAPDLAHAAGAERREDLVRPEALASGKRHGVRR